MRELVAITGGTYDVNVNGTLNVLRAGVRRVVNASSSSVYGNNPAGRQRETTPPAPLSPYGLSKWMGELYAAQFARGTAMKTVSLRYFNVFGPRQNQNSGDAAVIPRFLRKIADGIQPTIFGDGRQTRDFTFVGADLLTNDGRWRGLVEVTPEPTTLGFGVVLLCGLAWRERHRRKKVST